MKKYSKRSIVVHWLSFLLLIAAVVVGHCAAEAREEGNPELAAYMLHILGGNLILLLTLARLYFRKKDGVPPAMGDTPMDKMAKGIQHAVYFLLIALPVSGAALVASSGIGQALFAGDAALLPKDLDSGIHELHEGLIPVLVVLVLVHVLGALKHQFVLKDNIIGRMSLRDSE